jgi:hypothetical protein
MAGRVRHFLVHLTQVDRHLARMGIQENRVADNSS